MDQGGQSLGYQQAVDAAWHQRGQRAWAFSGASNIVLVLALLVGARVWVAAGLGLHWDETYYWQWSRHLSLSFYDHPPMVAYAIRLGTAVFGDGPLGLRAVAIGAMVAASGLVYLLALALFDDRRVATLSLLWFSVMPHTGFFSVIIFPDTPSILFWVLSCYGLAQVWRTGHGAWWYLVGIGFGLTMLSKYNGVFLIAGAGAWVLLAADMRMWLRRREPYLAALLSVAVFSPVLVWNAQNGWVSFGKQFGRVLNTVPEAGLANVGAYLGVQAAFVSPLIYLFALAGCGVALWRGLREGRSNWLLLGLTSAPTLLFFLFHALTDIVKTQWPSSAYPTAIIAGVALFAARAEAPGAPAWLRRSFCAAPWLGIVMTAALYLQMTLTVVPVVAAGDPMAIFSGWGEFARDARAAAAAQQAGYIATSEYVPTAILRYYLPEGPTVFQASEAIRYGDEAPVDQAMLADAPGLYVAAADRDAVERMRPYFNAITPLPNLVRTRGGDPIETFHVYLLNGYRGGLPFAGSWSAGERER